MCRREEKEVLLAMFGCPDEAVAVFGDEDRLDVALSVTAYEAPDRYGAPLPLMQEAFADGGVPPRTLNESLVLAVAGGGLLEVRSRP